MLSLKALSWLLSKPVKEEEGICAIVDMGDESPDSSGREGGREEEFVASNP